MITTTPQWGNFLNLLQKEGVPRKGEFPQKKGGGGVPTLEETMVFLKFYYKLVIQILACSLSYPVWNVACFIWSGKIPCEKLLLYSVDKIYETDELNAFRKVANIPYISLHFLL